MKKKFVLLLAVLTAVCLAACGGSNPDASGEPPEGGIEAAAEEDAVTEITLWTYPVGDWGNSTAVSSLVSGFRKEHPNIQISIELLEYDTGDAKISEALADGNAPDLVFESPERLTADWGDKGLMADLSDLWEDSCGKEIYDFVRNACRHSRGEYYIYPVCISAHCMAVNYDLFEAAGALQYLNEETRTWSTDDFINAVNALAAYGQKPVGAVYCGGQGGDQGTRALVTNLYGGSFTDADRTCYTADSEENIRALELLYRLDGIVFDPEMTGTVEIDRFCRGELAMAFCWNGSIAVSQTMKYPDMSFRILPMTFPTDSGEPELQGGIWGLGIFDNGSEDRIEAAKEFIRYVTSGDARYTRAVQMSNFWPVRKVENIYANDALMQEYSMFISYMGNYYQVTPNWTEARTAWWQMLQKIGAGEDAAASLKEFSDRVNGPLNG